MPYIPQEYRAELNDPSEFVPTTPGELNYAITRLLTEYLTDQGDHVPTYDRFNEVIGALECAKLELYRRMVAPYEDRKRFENGDVYP